jgi:leader peptidase (prepilin peptidase)/N-methyltransferase
MALLSVAVAPLLRWAAVAYSVPSGAPPRRACPECGARLGPGGPRGRCGCGRRLGPVPFGVEAAVVLLAVWAFLAVPPAVTPAYAWWAAAVVPLVFVDLAVHRLPDRLTFPAALGVYGLLGAAAAVTGDGGAFTRAALAGLAVGLFFATTTLLLGRRGFGLGDAKLAVSCAALLGWVGWPAVVAGLVLAIFASGLVSLALLAFRRVRWSTHLPFGPFLVVGTLAGLALA